MTQKETWRGGPGTSQGFNAGGTLATAGNVVFSNVSNRLYAFKADTGEQLLDLATEMGNPGPPMTFMLNGKQYIAIAGSIGGGGGGGRGGGGGGGGRGGGGGGAGATAPQGPQPPAARLLVLTLDGKPVVPPAATQPATPQE